MMSLGRVGPGKAARSIDRRARKPAIASFVRRPGRVLSGREGQTYLFGASPLKRHPQGSAARMTFAPWGQSF